MKAIYDIVITNPAEEDLFEIGRYISKELLEPDTARRHISRIADAISTLENRPLRATLINDARLAQVGIRSIIVDHYFIFYIVSEKIKTVTIIRVLNSRRDWQNLL
ncbi:type II toxin-antitoxin system RelE/ParE family toxin [Halalkalibacter lacteus]|uniref:type II toxin-antitoxin system RelE/ParE family toxin n=1 Tax=Halalkalibacter lacteus TaxID=3090663 RepID=UPI002FCAB26F